jgi:hypothetical protein
LQVSVPATIRPVPLSQRNDPHLNQVDIVAAGWGKQRNNRISAIMETVVLKVLSNADCIAELQNLNIPIHSLDRKHLCAVAEPRAILCEVSIVYVRYINCQTLLNKVLKLRGLIISINQGMQIL